MHRPGGPVPAARRPALDQLLVARAVGAAQPAEADAPGLVGLALAHEGLVLGGSTAINIVGAMKLAKELGPGKMIVTILADGGQRYQSKLFNPAYLREKNLPVPPWMK